MQTGMEDSRIMETGGRAGRRRGWRPLPALLACVLLLAACSPHVAIYPKLENLARRGQYEQAAKLVEESEELYDERNEVLFNLDRGLFHHYAGNFKKSNLAFAEAERRLDELFTESIARQTGAFLSNDNTLPYRGEDFESVVINVYRALNYIQLGDPDAALVEARKVNEKLLFINSKYEPDQQNVYKEDAFARMLAGILYELGGTPEDVNDAFISNRMAVQTYRGDFASLYQSRTPSVLKSNLITTASFMGREELGAAKRAFPGVKLVPLAEKRKKAQLYFVHFAGRGPIKYEDSIQAIMPDGYLMRIVFPKYRRRGYAVRGSRIMVDGKAGARLEPAAPIGRIAMKNLEDRKLRIAAKAIARATTKYVATKLAEAAAEEKGGRAAGLFTRLAGNVAAVVSEQADLRAWQTLPDRILLGQAMVEPGRHDIAVQFLGSTGAVMFTRKLGSVEVKAGDTRFFILHTLQ